MTFEVAPAASYTGRGYGLVTMFDCLHGMGDPASAARHVRESLAGLGNHQGRATVSRQFAGAGSSAASTI